MKIRFKSPKASHRQMNSSLTSILRRTKLCAMATASRRPCINNAFFCVTDELDFFFVSDPSTRHGRNLARNPFLAVAVTDSRQEWDGALSGCQLFGRCRLATATESETAGKLYGRRFPAYREYQAELTAEEKASSPHVFYVFRPTKVKLLDVRRFGDEVFIEAVIYRDA